MKAPRDPNLTADADDPADEVDPPEGAGLDQGAVARVTEPLTLEMLTPVAVPQRQERAGARRGDAGDGPLLGPPQTVPQRTYAAFGTSTRGRKGPLSKRVDGAARPAAAAAFGREVRPTTKRRSR